MQCRTGLRRCGAQLGTISVGPGSQSTCTKVCRIGSNWSNWLKAGVMWYFDSRRKQTPRSVFYGKGSQFSTVDK